VDGVVVGDCGWAFSGCLADVLCSVGRFPTPLPHEALMEWSAADAHNPPSENGATASRRVERSGAAMGVGRAKCGLMAEPKGNFMQCWAIPHALAA